MTPIDVTFLVFLSAAILAHRKVQEPEHAGIKRALVAIIVAELGTIVLWPNRGLLPILFLLAVPGACLYGICATHGFRARVSLLVTGGFVAFTWGCSLAGPDEYVWALLLSWCIIAGTAWLCLLDPEKHPTGITRVSAVVLAASLLADIPGIYTWARFGSWVAENVLSSLSVAILAMLPLLWKIRMRKPSSLGSCSLESELPSGFSSDAETDRRPQMRCE